MVDKLETRGGGGGDEKRKGKDFVQTKKLKTFLKGFGALHMGAICMY